MSWASAAELRGFRLRTHNENCASVCDRLSDSLKEGVILRGVPAPDDGVCLMVDVPGWMIRVQHDSALRPSGANATDRIELECPVKLRSSKLPHH